MIGWIAPRVSSELIPPSGPPFDANVIAETARIHERAGFDRVLIGYFSDAPDGFLVGAHAASVTERLGFLLAHRPGFVAPPVAARKLATLDQLSAGRLAVHMIAGGSDADQAKDGDWTDSETRYRRAAEYMSLLRRAWTEPAPFDHQGEFYRTRGTYSEIRCRQQPHIPIYGGGGSDAAIRALAPHVDVFMLWGEPLKDTALFMDRVRQEAALCGRSPTFSLSTRPILAATEGEAWGRARAILERCWPIAAALLHHSARISAPNVCCRPPRKPKCTTPACGRRSPSPPAPRGTRRPSSAPPKRSRRRCSNTKSSAPPAC
ncbi:MAG: LLM class flavin-dependent oxidoreductase [Stellaceae bacterium]